jgi:hypothetical protein
MAPSKIGQPNDVVDRYRQAAEVALDQLEWAIRYLDASASPKSRASWPRTTRTSGDS